MGSCGSSLTWCVFWQASIHPTAGKDPFPFKERKEESHKGREECQETVRWENQVLFLHAFGVHFASYIQDHATLLTLLIS